MRSLTALLLFLIVSFLSHAQDENNDLDDYGFKPKGFGANYEIGATDILGSDNNPNIPMMAVILSHGYHFNPHVFLGVATGVELSPGYKVYNIPLYADFRAYMVKTKATPFFNFGIGYNLLISENLSGFQTTRSKALNGFLVNPSLGLRIAMNQKIALTINCGYKFIGVPITVVGGSTDISSLHCITLRGGISF